MSRGARVYTHPDMGAIPPPPGEQTDAYEIITFLQLLLWEVKIGSCIIIIAIFIVNMEIIREN